jgi:hypothetical protein
MFQQRSVPVLSYVGAVFLAQSIHSKLQFLDCAIVAVNERYI